MRRILKSLWLRLVASHLLVAIIAVLTTALLSRSLAGGFFEDHLRDMTDDPGMRTGGMTPMMLDTLRLSFSSSFEHSVTIAALVSAAVAVAASAFAAVRVLRPVGRIRTAARRLAGGAYSERVPLPVEIELAALAEDVNSLAEALERVEERRVRLISEVAHELRTPLSTIEGYMEGLLDGVFEPTDQVFAITAKEASRLKRLANDLSALSAAEEGALQLRRLSLDLAAVAGEAAARLRPQFEAQGVALTVGLEEPLPVIGDPDRLAQVFTNIVGNALTVTEPGGAVEISGGRQRGSAVVTIRDTGPGLTGEQLDLVFERFYRVDKERSGGTGIGLTIARRFARLHQGDVRAASEGIGKGSTFTVSLPLATDRSGTRPPAGPIAGAGATP